MFKKRIWMMGFMLLGLVTSVSASEVSDDQTTPDDETTETTSPLDVIEAGREDVESGQHTQVEDDTSFEQPNPSLEGFELVAENDFLALYVQKPHLAIKVRNKATDYLWSSTLDDMSQHQLNETWQQLVQSAVTVEFLNQQDSERTYNLFSENTTAEVEQLDDGFRAAISFNEQISLDLEVRLEDDQVKVTIPEDSIQETEEARLLSLTVYPFLGAAKQTEIPGYIFLPDGAGALMRYEDTQLRMNFPYTAEVYGMDYGIGTEIVEPTSNPVYRATVPVFGMVHGANQNAMAAIIESGEEYATIEAYKAGLSTEFHWAHADFIFRKPYRQSTNRQGTNALSLYQENRNEMEIVLQYHFLADEEANYVGMAKAYQAELAEAGVLQANDEQAPLVRLEFLAGERKPGLFWDTMVSMTPLDHLVEHAQTLRDAGIEDMLMVYKGWGSGGLTGSFPNQFPLETHGSSMDTSQVQAELQEMEIPLYFHTDYTLAFQNPRSLGAAGLLEQINSNDFSVMLNERMVHYLTPDASLESFAADEQEYANHDINLLAVENSAERLFSVHNEANVSSRKESKQLMQDLFERMATMTEDQLVFYQPNQYAWQYMDKYFDIPMGSSNFIFISDTVPFLQIVLKGYVDYYATFANFSSNKQDDLLRMLEYGAYPSFYLTTEDPYALADTPSRDVFNSQFTSWEDEIVRQYGVVKELADATVGATIISREVLDPGVVQVSYDNGISVTVNYNSQDYQAGDLSIDAKAYHIMEGEE